jgi:DNA polymerase-1
VLLDTLNSGHDVHAATAKDVFDEIPEDCPVEKVKERYPDIRDDAKPVNFGIIYGIGARKLSKQLDCSQDKAQSIIDRYRASRPGVSAWIDKQHEMTTKHGFVYTLLGRKRHIPLGPVSVSRMEHARSRAQRRDWKYKKYRAQRIGQNSPIQGGAADIINVAMVQVRDWARNMQAIEIPREHILTPSSNISKPDVSWKDPLWGNWFRMLIQVHDEIVCEFHPSIANWGMDTVVDIMESGYSLRVPLIVDAALGYNWNDTKK